MRKSLCVRKCVQPSCHTAVVADIWNMKVIWHTHQPCCFLRHIYDGFETNKEKEKEEEKEMDTYCVASNV